MFYWSLVSLQCSVSLHCIAKWISCTDTYIPSFFGFPSHLAHHKVLSRVPCYMATSNMLSILYIVGYRSIPVSQFIYPHPLCVSMFLLYVCVSISVFQINSFVSFLDLHLQVILHDTFFLFMTFFTLYDSLQVYPHLGKWHSSFLFMSA